MNLRVITQPTSEPVTLAEAKDHLRLEESRDDSQVTAMIIAARQYIEKLCWRALMLQTVEVTRPGFGGADRYELTPEYVATTPESSSEFNRVLPYIELPGGQLAATPNVVVKYLDTSGVLQTLDPSAYIVDAADQRNGRVWLNEPAGYSWPSTLARFDAVRVQYDIGWATSANVPGPLKQSVLLLISQMYEHRSPQITGTIATSMEFTIDALTSPYRLLRL